MPVGREGQSRREINKLWADEVIPKLTPQVPSRTMGRVHVIYEHKSKEKDREGNTKKDCMLYFGANPSLNTTGSRATSPIRDSKIASAETEDGVFRLEDSASAEQGSWGSGKK